MKRIVFVLLTLCTSAMLSAQQPMASLNHNDSITVFYGSNALMDAHAVAVNGDIITLSSGSFNTNNSTITKAITIRGAGMLPDSVANTDRTILQGWFCVDVPFDSVYHFTLEGVKLTEPAINRYNRLFNAKFVKCYIPRFYPTNYSSSKMQNVTFINCYIGLIDLKYDLSIGNVFFNSYVALNKDMEGTGTTISNCVAWLNPANANNVNIQNSILYYWRTDNYYRGQPQSHSRNSFTSYYSIGCNGYNGNTDYFDTTDVFNHNLRSFGSLNAIFKNFNHTTELADCTSFELQDSIATTILGNDSTQVGIYGGLYPFDPRVSNPNIRRINVANRSTADGKLSVDIEVVNE